MYLEVNKLISCWIVFLNHELVRRFVRVFQLKARGKILERNLPLRITSAVAEVDVHDLCISVAGRDLLKDAHLKLCAGQRYGFVGRNGSGKSTLFRSMASGRIPGYPANCVTLLVDQEDVGDERTAVDTVSRSYSFFFYSVKLRALF